MVTAIVTQLVTQRRVPSRHLAVNQDRWCGNPPVCRTNRSAGRTAFYSVPHHSLGVSNWTMSHFIIYLSSFLKVQGIFMCLVDYPIGKLIAVLW